MWIGEGGGWGGGVVNDVNQRERSSALFPPRSTPTGIHRSRLGESPRLRHAGGEARERNVTRPDCDLLVAAAVLGVAATC